MTDPVVLVPVLVLLGLVGCAVWVLRDARAHARSGHRVGVYAGRLSLDTPEAWACACLVLWVLFFPLYLRARTES